MRTEVDFGSPWKPGRVVHSVSRTVPRSSTPFAIKIRHRAPIPCMHGSQLSLMAYAIKNQLRVFLRSKKTFAGGIGCDELFFFMS